MRRHTAPVRSVEASTYLSAYLRSIFIPASPSPNLRSTPKAERGEPGDRSFSKFSSSDRSDFQPYAAKPQYAWTGYPAKSHVLIIGDSLTSDIQGGVDYGLDTCWYNPIAEPRPGDLQQITYEIRHLRELLELID